MLGVVDEVDMVCEAPGVFEEVLVVSDSSVRGEELNISEASIQAFHGLRSVFVSS